MRLKRFLNMQFRVIKMMAWETNQVEHGSCLMICEMEIKREIHQSTYGETISVGMERHNIVEAVRRLTSETRFSQTLMATMEK